MCAKLINCNTFLLHDDEVTKILQLIQINELKYQGRRDSFDTALPNETCLEMGVPFASLLLRLQT